jgi:hypothetical protein
LRSFKMGTNFDFSFWETTLGSLSYPMKAEALDVNTLKETKAVPRDFSLKQVSRVYQDSYVEVAILRSDDGSKLSRSTCTRTTRMWRQNRLKRPLLLFTNGTESYAVIVPGTKTDGEAKILWLSDNLYRTDREVIESLRYPGNPDSLRQAYDTTFFPYERVRSEFFVGYRDLYAKIEKAVKKHLKKESSSYAQRFLGRLMFVYFLQRKGWLRNDKQFINSIADYKKLNELFYESLNKEGTPGIPFLNGSLFEREEYMSRNLEKDLFKAMDPLFKKARSFFNDYNFTVDEASPLELEVSIDPALIGTVFENMLPEYERGSKGTFYTPASESSFICRRALANYLGYPDLISDDKTHFQDGLRLYIEKLRGMKSEKEVRDFREKLLKTVILDPAVGSGGFLLVAMQEIILIIQEAESTVGWKSDPEEHKKRILPNLYGFDIEGEAIEIARLRLWLSLIIDQKEPEPLPNLDMNLVQIPDSLRLPDIQTTLDTTIEDLRSNFHDLKEKYLNEHDARVKTKLRDQLNKIRTELANKTDTDPFVIEAFVPIKPNIVVMNPPYVRQEAIPERLKSYYAAHYKLDKKSDLFAYFLVRALNLLSSNGVVSVISSDKWLETTYGLSLQQRLKNHLIAIYGQRERSFGADINTVISVYKASNDISELHFTYLESYSNNILRHHIVFKKADLQTGKWFFLRAGAKFYLEELWEKMNRRLDDFGEIRRGFTSGANEFFYMKDINQLFEADYLANEQKFRDYGITTSNRAELERKGWIYIENEGGERFVIDGKDTLPMVRSPKQLGGYKMARPQTLCLYTSSPGKMTMKYIQHGEKTGINKRPTLKSRNPWYQLADLKPTNILLLKSTMENYYVPFSEVPLLTDQRLYTLSPSIDPINMWLYLSSTIFMLTEEMHCRRLGGGAADMAVEDYQEIPVSELSNIKIDYPPQKLEGRTALSYSKEILEAYRKDLDVAVLKAIGFENPESLLEHLYAAYKDAVEDRIIKGGRLAQPEQEDYQ